MSSIVLVKEKLTSLLGKVVITVCIAVSSYLISKFSISLHGEMGGMSSVVITLAVVSFFSICLYVISHKSETKHRYIKVVNFLLYFNIGGLLVALFLVIEPFLNRTVV